jgi:hypothetical protein
MMKILKKAFHGATLVAALLLTFSQVATAGTILKLSLGNDPTADLAYSGGFGGVLSTIDDGDGASPGDQNTAVEFLDFLSSMTNIPAADASYSLSGATAAGPASVVGTVVLQSLTGGTFQLWDDDDVTLLLDVALGDSTIVGQVGNPAGAVFSATFGTPLAGTLASQIAPGTISMSISMTDINGGGGMSVTPDRWFLARFLHCGCNEISLGGENSRTDGLAAADFGWNAGGSTGATPGLIRWD